MLRKAAKFHRDAVRPKAKTGKTEKPKLASIDTALPGVSASDKKKGQGHTEPRNAAARADKKAAFKLEDSASGRPSRKSTRGSSNRAKPDSNLKQRQTRKATSPKARARRGK
ncbi:MAG: hypothetical protein IPM35_08455 [Myxococcales bacterium]|nr:hypothetical protein [Myxococcales bacterium]